MKTYTITIMSVKKLGGGINSIAVMNLKHNYFGSALDSLIAVLLEQNRERIEEELNSGQTINIEIAMEG